MLMVLAIAPMGLDNHDVTTLEGVATDMAEDIVYAPDPTAHEGTQQPTSVVIKRLA